jgi:hypothetical protein
MKKKEKIIPVSRVLEEDGIFFFETIEGEEKKYFSILESQCSKTNGEYLVVAEIIESAGSAVRGKERKSKRMPAGDGANAPVCTLYHALHYKTELNEEETIPGVVQVDENDKKLLTAKFVNRMSELANGEGEK